VDDEQQDRQLIARECQDISEWIAQETGIGSVEVSLALPWPGEDRPVGVRVFRAVTDADAELGKFGVREWWIVVEESGTRSLYPVMLSTAGDAVRYHTQVNTPQAKRES